MVLLARVCVDRDRQAQGAQRSRRNVDRLHRRRDVDRGRAFERDLDCDQYAIGINAALSLDLDVEREIGRRAADKHGRGGRAHAPPWDIEVGRGPETRDQSLDLGLTAGRTHRAAVLALDARGTQCAIGQDLEALDLDENTLAETRGSEVFERRGRVVDAQAADAETPGGRVETGDEARHLHFHFVRVGPLETRGAGLPVRPGEAVHLYLATCGRGEEGGGRDRPTVVVSELSLVVSRDADARDREVRRRDRAGRPFDLDAIVRVVALEQRRHETTGVLVCTQFDVVARAQVGQSEARQVRIAVLLKARQRVRAYRCAEHHQAAGRDVHRVDGRSKLDVGLAPELDPRRNQARIRSEPALDLAVGPERQVRRAAAVVNGRRGRRHPPPRDVEVETRHVTGDQAFEIGGIVRGAFQRRAAAFEARGDQYAGSIQAAVGFDEIAVRRGAPGEIAELRGGVVHRQQIDVEPPGVAVHVARRALDLDSRRRGLALDPGCRNQAIGVDEAAHFNAVADRETLERAWRNRIVERGRTANLR